MQKRLNNSPESNRGELEKNNWLIIGYTPGGINASDGLTKSMTGVVLKRLLNEHISQIVAESQKGEIRKRLPAAKHYIVYPETTQGNKDLDNNMRRKTRVERCSHWQVERAGKTSLNSAKLHGDNSKRKTSKTKP